MRNYLVGLFIVLSAAGCSKQMGDKTVVHPPATTDDVNTFLGLAYPVFEGNLNGSFFSKAEGADNYFCNTGWFNGDTDGICYPDEPQRCVIFGLTAQGGGNGSFALYSPRYNSASDSAWLQTFSPGAKSLGSRVRNFYLSMNLGTDTYETSNSNQSNQINILKTEPFTDATGSRLRVWFTLNATLVSPSTGQTATLTNGMMVGEFTGYKSN